MSYTYHENFDSTVVRAEHVTELGQELTDLHNYVTSRAHNNMYNVMCVRIIYLGSGKVHVYVYRRQVC